MNREEIEEAIRTIQERAKALTQCGSTSIERRAAEILAVNYCLVWAELPFEACELLVEWEIPRTPGAQTTFL